MFVADMILIGILGKLVRNGWADLRALLILTKPTGGSVGYDARKGVRRSK